MKLNRRTFFKGVLASAVTVVVAPTLSKPAEVVGSSPTKMAFPGYHLYNEYNPQDGYVHPHYGKPSQWEYRQLLQGKWKALETGSDLNTLIIDEYSSIQRAELERWFLRGGA